MGARGSDPGRAGPRAAWVPTTRSQPGGRHTAHPLISSRRSTFLPNATFFFTQETFDTVLKELPTGFVSAVLGFLKRRACGRISWSIGLLRYSRLIYWGSNGPGDSVGWRDRSFFQRAQQRANYFRITAITPDLPLDCRAGRWVSKAICCCCLPASSGSRRSQAPRRAMRVAGTELCSEGHRPAGAVRAAVVHEQLVGIRFGDSRATQNKRWDVVGHD